jgi:hypothetical protein
LALVEVAAYRVADLRVQIGQILGFGEDRLSQGPCGEAALGRFLDEEDYF